MSDVQIAVIDQQDTQIVLAVPGVQGATGSSIPSGGTIDQVLRKNSSTDYDAGWTQVTSAMIANGAIVNEDINNGAGIAGTKISPDFGGQAVTTTGQVSAARVNVTNNTPPSNGIYLPSANNVAISTDGSGRLFVDASGRVLVGTSSTSANATLLLQGYNGTQANAGGHLRLAIPTATPASGQNLGIILFSDSEHTNCALISADRDGGTWSGASKPTRLVFSTTENGASSPSPTERLRITSAGLVGVGNISPNYTLDVNGAIASRKQGNVNDLGYKIDDGSWVQPNLIGHYYTGSTDATSIRVPSAAASTSSALYLDNNGVFQVIGTGSATRLTVDSSGRLLVGTSSAFDGSTVIQAKAIASVSPGILDLQANFTSNIAGQNIGAIRFLSGDNAYRASIYCASDGDSSSSSDAPGRLVFSTTADGASSPTERIRIANNGIFTIKTSANDIAVGGTLGTTIAAATRAGIHFGAPASLIPTDGNGALTDNACSLGISAYRWSTVYAGTGTINTSDSTLKQDIAGLGQAELNVAATIKTRIKKFRFVDAVASKGDDARIHVGVIAQEVEQAFVDEGLDPRRYAMFCEDTLDDGSKRLGIRYDELLAFVIAAL